MVEGIVVFEFEKKLNLYSQFNDDDSWSAEFKKNIPQFKTTYFDLFFTENKTFYKPGRENTDNNRLWEQPAENNIVYTDLEKRSAVSQKNVFEKTFLIQYSTRTIQWKITDEKRTIAGFECRKAVTKICDSVYVVAFYTDQIAVSSGPESFGGLPGLILGLAVPRLYTTWFATKLELVEPTATQLNPTQKGKKVNWNQLYAELNQGLKRWGKEAEKRLWIVSM